MNELSWRHHYIPEFYLRGFTNESGKFKIFDIENDEFINGGKDFTPRSYFFEKHGNTLESNSKKDDFLETTFYSRIDNDISNLFQRITNAPQNTNFGISDEEMPALQHFIATMYWRIPANYGQIEHLIKKSDLRSFGILIKDSEGHNIQNSVLENRLKGDSNFFKMMKYGLPLITYSEIFACGTPLHIQTFPSGLPSLCSDNPVIFENSETPNIYTDDLIFPITSDLVFIRSNKINNILTDIKIDIDVIVLKQAKKYVSCTDPKYIPILNQYYEEHYHSLDDLKKKVFKKLVG